MSLLYLMLGGDARRGVDGDEAVDDARPESRAVLEEAGETEGASRG